MSFLGRTAMIFGLVVAMAHAPLLFIPGPALRWIRGFPRRRWAGWVLAAIDLVWVGWLVHTTPWPWIWVEAHKPWLIVAVPVMFALVVWLMDELLAARALGGLFMLVPWTILDAAFLHPSSLRLVVVVAAYLMAIAGMTLTLSPYQLRRALNAVIKTDSAARIWGGLGVAFGIVVIVLSATAY